MRINTKKLTLHGEQTITNCHLATIIKDKIIYSYNESEEAINMLTRLVDILANKGVLNEKDISYFIDSSLTKVEFIDKEKQ